MSHIAVLCRKPPNRYHHGSVGVHNSFFMHKDVGNLMSVLLVLLAIVDMLSNVGLPLHRACL